MEIVYSIILFFVVIFVIYFIQLFNYWSDGSDPTGIVKDTKNWFKDLDTSSKYPWLNGDYNYKNTNYKEYVYIPPDDKI
ncbi:MAG: hypothetical protein IAE65_06260 [Ignavibacteria bacterium]|nr:hypothetical protein [Ignavibacteria bacterium]